MFAQNQQNTLPTTGNVGVGTTSPDVENNYSITILNSSSHVLMADIALNEKLNSIDIRGLAIGVYQVVVTSRVSITHFKLVVE